MDRVTPFDQIATNLVNGMALLMVGLIALMGYVFGENRDETERK